MVESSIFTSVLFNFSATHQGATNVCMYILTKKPQKMYRSAKFVHRACDSVITLFTLLCKCSCDILQGITNHVQVSTSSAHLCTVREGGSGYLSMWEAECTDTCKCAFMLVFASMWL